MERLLNVATPFTAFTFVVPLNVPPAGFVPIAIATAAVLVVTTLLFASSTCTVTAGVMAEQAAVFEGCVPNTSCVAVPGVMLKVLLVPAVNPVLLAARV